MIVAMQIRGSKRILVIKKLEAGTGVQAKNSCRRCQRRAAEDSGGISIEACVYGWFLVRRSAEKILEDGVRVLVLVVMAPESWLMVVWWMLAVAV